jgi:hypothetical protein
MAEQTYDGSCHCGAVAFQAQVDLDQPVIACNCSHCRRKGFLLSFVAPAKFELRSGKAALSDYRFNTHRIDHQFCQTCGVQAFAEGKGPDGSSMVAINIRCLEGVDLGALNVQDFDGASV